jgi:hypothetical protein
VSYTEYLGAQVAGKELILIVVSLSAPSQRYSTMRGGRATTAMVLLLNRSLVGEVLYITHILLFGLMMSA